MRREDERVHNRVVYVHATKVCQLQHRSGVLTKPIGTYTKGWCDVDVAAQFETCFPQFRVIAAAPPGCWSANCPKSSTPLPACGYVQRARRSVSSRWVEQWCTFGICETSQSFSAPAQMVTSHDWPTNQLTYKWHQN